MKLKLIGLALTGLIIAGMATTQGRGSADQPPVAGAMAQFIAEPQPTPVPAASFGGGHDDTLDLASFHGKLVLVNMWATWCAPCVHELPALEALKTQRDSDRFVVVTISEDRQGSAAVEPFLDKIGIKSLTRYTDPKSEFGRALKVRGLPTTILIGPDGEELGRLEGNADWSSPDALALVDWYLAHQRSVTR